MVNSETRRILVVDDDRDLREVVSLLLEEEGFHVRCAENGREALACLETYEPAVILLDMRMPVMDGWQFMKELRQRQPHTSATVIVFTAAEDARQRAQEIGTPYFISKPFEIDEVLRTVRSVLPVELS
ncbi:MAG: response regulator [Oligoflexia bacterium]|nr:response regulator [Oligoflexia bacterium]